MTSGAHTGDSLPTNLHSPVTAKTATGFGSYEEYLWKLKGSTGSFNSCSTIDELWLGSFDENGRCAEWAYYDLGLENRLEVPTNLPALDGTGVRPHMAVLSADAFRTVLQNPDERVSYRVVLVTAGRHGISSHTKDILGIGLDLGPEFFEYAQMCVDDPRIRGRVVLPRSWHKVPPALRVGRNALCMLEAGLGKATKTGIRNRPFSSSHVS